MTFVKGQSGNPEGRPVGAKNFTTKVREALEKIADGKDYTYEEAFIKSILKKGIVDGDSGTQRLIWNYLDGLPAQRFDENSPLSVSIKISKEVADKYNETNSNSSNNSKG